MRILSIHADRIYYKANRKTGAAEPADALEDFMEQCMVFFSCIEKLDESNPQRVVEKAKDKLIKRLGQVKENNLMIFPYAHLAIGLSSPEVALNILKGLESALFAEGFNVKRAPFGWYKEFELRAKGHPMAESLIEISPYDISEDIFCPWCGAPSKIGWLGLESRGEKKS